MFEMLLIDNGGVEHAGIDTLLLYLSIDVLTINSPQSFQLMTDENNRIVAVQGSGLVIRAINHAPVFVFEAALATPTPSPSLSFPQAHSSQHVFTLFESSSDQIISPFVKVLSLGTQFAQ